MCTSHVYIKVVPIQHFKYDTSTDIFILIPINKIYPTDIIKLTDTSFTNQY